MIIFKGKRALKKLHIPAGVVVEVQLKGWNDASLAKVWIQRVLFKYTQKQHAFLILDTFTGHMTDVAELLQRQKNITTVGVPGECMSKIQPVAIVGVSGTTNLALRSV